MPLPSASPASSAPTLEAAQAERVARQMAEHPLFRELPTEVLAALLSSGALLAFAPGDVLITQGEPSDSALLIVEGSADISIDTAYDHVHLATCRAPAFVGEIGAFMGVARTASIKAASEVRAVRLAAEDLHQAGRAHPGFLAAVMRHLGGRFETFNRAIGFYSNALAALERQDFDVRLLDELKNPLPELVDFGQSFRRLAEEIMVRKAHRRDMANAAAIQRAMLPEPLSESALGGRADVAAQMRPATLVGGDFYDFFLLPDDRLVVSVGDVSGKGIPASLFMSATQTALRYVLRNEEDLSEGVRIANDLLCATNSEMMFVTLFCAVLDLKSGALAYCNCGHTDCLILKRDGSVERPLPTSMALGMQDGIPFPARRVQLAPGDRLFLFTDGLTDAVAPDGTPFGEPRLDAAAERLRDLPTDAFIGAVLDEIGRHKSDAAQFDDETVLAVTYLGTAG